jgi:hypothetical protein
MEPDRDKIAKPSGTPQLLPLVVEIIPGLAGEGLIAVHEPGSYEGASLQELCDAMLARQDWSIEELQVLEDIQRQLTGGKLLAGGRAIGGPAAGYSVLEETPAGESYLYVAVRAIRPQEGGA